MLDAFQNVYVRLCADAALRGRFLRDPDGVLGAYALCDRERAALRDLDRDGLTRFAESLLAKRCDEFAPHLRQTLRVCPDLTARYRRWLALNPARVVEPVDPDAAPLPPGLSEALRAQDALVSDVRADASLASYVACVLRFEVWEQASRLDAQIRILRARWRIDAIMADLRRGLLPVDPDEGRWLFRFSKEGVSWRSA